MATLSTIRVRMMTDTTITVDNNPALELRIARLEDHIRDRDYEIAQWKHRCVGYETLLLKLYSQSR
jgi:hypothetical protein